MCLSEAIVIVIVRSRNGEGSRFEYINVRKESRMVARLPQQVFLLLVLVTGTTSGTVHRAKQPSWTTGSSTRRIGPPAATLSHSTTPKADTPGRTYSHGRNILGGFEETLLDAGITIDAEVPISRNLYSRPAFSISDAKGSTHERKKIRSSRHELEDNLDTMGIHMQDPEHGRYNNNQNSQSKSKLTSEQSWFHSDEETSIFSTSVVVSSPVEGIDPFYSEAAFESAPMPPLSSSWVTLERSDSIDKLMGANSLHTKVEVASAASDRIKMANTGNTLLRGRGKQVEDASLETRDDRKVSVTVQSLAGETSQADDHKVLINESLNHQEKSARDDHNVINHSLNHDKASQTNDDKVDYNRSLSYEAKSPQADEQRFVNELLDHEGTMEPSKKIDDQSVRRRGRGKQVEDASLETRDDRKVSVTVQSLAGETSQADDHKVLINESLNHQEKSARDDHNVINHSLNHDKASQTNDDKVDYNRSLSYEAKSPQADEQRFVNELLDHEGTMEPSKKIDDQSVRQRGPGKQVEDASLETRDDRKVSVTVQSLDGETSQADDHKVLIDESLNHHEKSARDDHNVINHSLNHEDKASQTNDDKVDYNRSLSYEAKSPRADEQRFVNESLDHEGMMEPSKKIDDQSVRHSFSSLQFIAARPIVNKLQPEKSKTSEEVRKIAGLSKVSHRILTEEEKASYLDTPPPNFLSASSMDQPPKDNAEKIDPSSDHYRKRNFDWLTSEPIPSQMTSQSITAVGFPKRYARDAETDQCENFMIDDSSKREFYSPNYPQNYPPNINCIRTLEAEKGMLLKLDFRERFELESMTPLNDKVGECRFDYLEVRDGQYGFSNLLGVFCDKQFPPEIISKSRHLWLRFHSDDTIEYKGFKAVWSTIPRPTTSGVPPEQEPCFRNITNDSDVIVTMDDVREEKKNAERYKVSLDCLWVITAPADSRMQLTFDPFKLEKPNDCSANFLEVFDQRTDIPSRLKNFCGSMAETVHTTKNVVFIRFYLEPKAINGTFKSLITVVRDKGSTDKPCRDNEYDCDDNTCIALSLRCNDRYNCRFLRDEDTTMCGTTTEQFDSSRVIIILVIFSLIMFGMCFAFVFNCVRKLIRDHRIIREHIRQSRENRLDEIGRKTTPCPISLSRTDLREHGSESPSVEIDSSKELIPSTLLGHEYAKELVLEMKYGSREANDIHQSNNVSNATQERLQESTEELEMCDSSCQTRESLFEPRIPVATLPSPPFSTFGYSRDSESQTGISPQRKMTPQQSDERHRYHHHHHHHQHPHPPPRQCSQQSHQSYPSNSPPSRHPVSEQCSVCLTSNSRESSLVICPKHNPIPAPPGWSVHDPPYPHLEPNDSRRDDSGSTNYERYQSPKPDRNPIATRNHQYHHQTPVYTRQNTVGSGERYDSLIYGSARASSNATSNSTSASNQTTGSGGQNPPTTKYPQSDPRYRAEAIIEVDQKRPFSIESTKSAPDVIATH